MSKGLGKVQHAILDILEEKDKEISVKSLAMIITSSLHPSWSKHNSVCRAVRSLKDKELIETTTCALYGFKGRYFTKTRESTWTKMVRLKKPGLYHRFWKCHYYQE